MTPSWKRTRHVAVSLVGVFSSWRLSRADYKWSTPCLFLARVRHFFWHFANNFKMLAVMKCEPHVNCCTNKKAGLRVCTLIIWLRIVRFSALMSAVFSDSPAREISFSLWDGALHLIPHAKIARVIAHPRHNMCDRVFWNSKHSLLNLCCCEVGVLLLPAPDLNPSSWCALSLGETVCLASSLRCVYRMFKGASSPPFWCQGILISTLFMRDAALPEIIEKTFFLILQLGSRKGPSWNSWRKMVLVRVESVRFFLNVFKPRCFFWSSQVLHRHAIGFQIIFHAAGLVGLQKESGAGCGFDFFFSLWVYGLSCSVSTSCQTASNVFLCCGVLFWHLFVNGFGHHCASMK